MKKYFLRQAARVSASEVSLKQIETYRELLIAEMKKLGAEENEFALICNALIMNSIRNDRRPEDVAWAILQ